jgi:hypothetical protein
MSSECRLDELAGVTTPCTEDACPFWEAGGAVLEGRCAFERLDLLRRPAVVSELLRLREELTAAKPRDRSAVHSYHRLLNESGGE